jgi:glycosyltransferase involved in cell wall biosynthesis
MTPALVSVVMPVYNGERFLQQSIRSVLAQTYRHVELIVVNDGSTDGSATVLESFGAQLTVMQQSNSGVAEARNAGIRAARGEFIAFLDQDDWWQPEKIERQVECFSRDEQIGLVHTAAAYHDDVSGGDAGGSSPDAVRLTGFCYEQLLLDNLICNSSVMVRRSVLDAVGLVDTTVQGNTVQDYELWLRIARRFSFDYVPKQLTIWRLHSGQGYWKRRTMLTQELQLLERHLAEPPTGLLRLRLAALLEELGRVYLDAGESSQARHYFARSFQMHPSRRNAIFCVLSYLPRTFVPAIQHIKARLSGPKEKTTTSRLPAWVDQVERSAPPARNRVEDR